MCGTVALGLAGGLIASKLLFHRRRFRRHHHWRRWRDHHAAPVSRADAPARLHQLLPILELNERQREEAREAFGDVAQALGAGWPAWGGLDEALAAIAVEPFDRARAEAALGPLDEAVEKTALDALEHVHNILTAEQRDRLAREVTRDWR